MSSYLKNKPDLFLGVGELVRMQRFLGQDGYRRYLSSISERFGIIKNDKDTGFSNFRVVEDVTGSGEFRISVDSVAIDSVGRFIIQPTITGQSVPSDSSWYWIKISHTYSPTEEGRVSIDSNGNVTGVGTKFTEILRGGSDFPSKIKFIGSSLNLLEYSIVEVISDTSLLLAGTAFSTEVSLSYSVAGTFTPGAVPSPSEKYPFQYDSCTIQLIAETVAEQEPAKTDGEEFYLCRVRNIAGTLEVEDKRREIYTTSAEFNLSNIIKDPSPLIGVESVKWTNPSTTKDKSILTIGWGVRSKNWTLDPNNNALTFSTSSLLGGKYKSTSQFSSGELVGWYVYFTDGSYSEIYQSKKQGSSIQVLLKYIDPSKITTGDILRVVPGVESIQIRVLSDSKLIPNIEVDHTFDIIDGVGEILVEVPEPTYKYVVEYRYIKNLESTIWLQIPTDTDNGYYDESSFTPKGVLSGTTNRKTYTSDPDTGFIEVKRNPDSYTDFVGRVDLGDIKGVDEVSFSSGVLQTALQVGTDKQYQHFTGSSVTFAGDSFIILSKEFINTDPIKNGNTFFIHIEQLLALANSSLSIRIVEDYVDAVTYTELYKITEKDLKQISRLRKGLFLRCTYNGTAWFVANLNEWKSDWKKVDITGSKVIQINSVSGDDGSISFVQVGPTADVRSYLKYVRNGNTVTLNFRLFMQLVKYSTKPASSVAIIDLPDEVMPIDYVEGACRFINNTPLAGSISQKGTVFIDPSLAPATNPNRLVFIMDTVGGSNAFFNRLYDWESPVEVTGTAGLSLVVTSAIQFFPEIGFSGTITYEV